jgi:hypothetical protein
MMNASSAVANIVLVSQRAGSTVTEVAASHSVYVSQPAVAAALIKQAAGAVVARQ